MLYLFSWLTKLINRVESCCIMQDPTKFAVAAAPVAAAAETASTPAAAAEPEKKEEPAEESDDDMGFSLFD